MAGSRPTVEHICSSLGLSDSKVGGDGWKLYLSHLVGEIQTSVKLRLSHEIVTKHLEPFFTYLLSNGVQDCCDDLETLHFLLATLLKATSLSSSLENALSVYLASMIENQTVKNVLSSSEGLAAELSFLFERQAGFGYDLEALRALDSNVVPTEALNRYMERGLALQTILSE